MDHKEIRRLFIEFFVARGHLEIPGSSLVPEYDPTLLLTNSGMAPLKPYFLGSATPPSRRLVNVQKCVRTSDIESVGDIHHLTFFEMLGNWGIGDPEASDGVGSGSYFKKEAISFAWDLLGEFGIDRNRIWVGIFGGDKDLPAVPPDTESAKIWSGLGLADERILKLPSRDSFWSSGPTGPCGPNTDVIYDLGENFSCGKATCGPTCECGRFLEIWNAGVFMMYNRREDGTFGPLPGKSVDAGAGLERFALVLQGAGNVYETDLFKEIVDQIESLAGVGVSDINQRSVRIIADHTRAATFLAADGVLPSNTERGYILRHLIRRSILHGLLLDINGYFLGQISGKIIEKFSDTYPNLSIQRLEVLKILEDEERFFGVTMKKGLKEFNRLVGRDRNVVGNVFSGEAAFKLSDSFGFPLEMTADLLKQKGLSVDRESFEKSLEKQRHQSKQSRPKEGYNPEKIYTAHTGAHLLNAALKAVLGSSVHQMGQKITEKNISHDFNLNRKMTKGELALVEEMVNTTIAENLRVTSEEVTLEKAQALGAEALFEDKYRKVDKVTLYRIGDFSLELCGGPHAGSTGELKKFKIIKEKSVAAGIRRIKAQVEG